MLVVITAIVIATLVGPPAAAWWLNGHRVKQTQSRADRAATAIAASADTLESSLRSVEVACGPGQLPKPTGRAEQDGWLTRAVMAPEAFGAGMPTDAWGHCFLLNIGERRRGGAVWILSAGPNGRIDTLFGARTLGGDDIGAPVR